MLNKPAVILRGIERKIKMMQYILRILGRTHRLAPTSTKVLLPPNHALR